MAYARVLNNRTKTWTVTLRTGVWRRGYLYTDTIQWCWNNVGCGSGVSNFACGDISLSFWADAASASAFDTSACAEYAEPGGHECEASPPGNDAVHGSYQYRLSVTAGGSTITYDIGPPVEFAYKACPAYMVTGLWGDAAFETSRAVTVEFSASFDAIVQTDSWDGSVHRDCKDVTCPPLWCAYPDRSATWLTGGKVMLSEEANATAQTRLRIPEIGVNVLLPVGASPNPNVVGTFTLGAGSLEDLPGGTNNTDFDTGETSLGFSTGVYVGGGRVQTDWCQMVYPQLQTWTGGDGAPGIGTTPWYSILLGPGEYGISSHIWDDFSAVLGFTYEIESGLIDVSYSPITSKVDGRPLSPSPHFVAPADGLFYGTGDTGHKWWEGNYRVAPWPLGLPILDPHWVPDYTGYKHTDAPPSDHVHWGFIDNMGWINQPTHPRDPEAYGDWRPLMPIPHDDVRWPTDWAPLVVGVAKQSEVFVWTSDAGWVGTNATVGYADGEITVTATADGGYATYTPPDPVTMSAYRFYKIAHTATGAGWTLSIGTKDWDMGTAPEDIDTCCPDNRAGADTTQSYLLVRKPWDRDGGGFDECGWSWGVDLVPFLKVTALLDGDVVTLGSITGEMKSDAAMFLCEPCIWGDDRDNEVYSRYEIGEDSAAQKTYYVYRAAMVVVDGRVCREIIGVSQTYAYSDSLHCYRWVVDCGTFERVDDSYVPVDTFTYWAYPRDVPQVTLTAGSSRNEFLTAERDVVHLVPARKEIPGDTTVTCSGDYLADGLQATLAYPRRRLTPLKRYEGWIHGLVFNGQAAAVHALVTFSATGRADQFAYTDDHGYYCSPALHQRNAANDGDLTWTIKATMPEGADVTTTAVVKNRHYIRRVLAGTWGAQVAAGPNADRDLADRVWVVWGNGAGVQVRTYTADLTSYADQEYSADVEDSQPAVLCSKFGLKPYIWLAYGDADDSNVYITRSTDGRAGTWEAAVVVGAGAYPRVVEDPTTGVTWVAYWRDGAIYARRRMGQAAAAYEAEALWVSDAAEGPFAVRMSTRGLKPLLYLAYSSSSGAVVRRESGDAGQTWSGAVSLVSSASAPDYVEDRTTGVTTVTYSDGAGGLYCVQDAGSGTFGAAKQVASGTLAAGSAQRYLSGLKRRLVCWYIDSAGMLNSKSSTDAGLTWR